MREEQALMVAVWLVASLLGTGAVSLAVAETWRSFRDPTLRADPVQAPVFLDILLWEMGEHAIRVLMELFSWVLLFLVFSAAPPAQQPPVTLQGVAAGWSLVAFRVLFTLKNMLNLGANMARKRRAERRREAVRRIALRKAQQAAQLAGIAPEMHQETLAPGPSRSDAA